MNIYKSLATAAIALALAGCERQIGEGPIAVAASDKALADVLKAARAIDDPWKAFQAIEEVKAPLCARATVSCGDYPSSKQVKEDQARYLTDAIARGERKAFEELYLPERAGDEYAVVQTAPGNISRFLAYADQLQGSSTADGKLLRRAALIVIEGRDAVRDTSRASSLLSRAWAAGDSDAAGSAGRLYLANNDYRNAYLWSLRCTAKCTRDSRIDLDSLQHRLSPEAIKQAQQAALDPSVVELDTTGD